MPEQLFPIVKLVGGLFIFLFGMNLVRTGLEKAAGDKLRSIINRLIKDRFRSFLTGIVATFIMESSGAATVMFVGFASVGLLDLFQSIALTAGATVGTTLFVAILAQFISLDLVNFAFGFVIIGSIAVIIKKKGIVHYFGDAIVGFGILFLGVYFMMTSVESFSGSGFFKNMLSGLSNYPLLGILASMTFTAIIHSSAGTIGIALSLTNLGSITLEAALPIIIGANVGTCFTAILAAIASPVRGKRVAWAHFVMKFIGAMLLFPFLKYYASFVEMMTQNVNIQVALAHLFFNLFNSVWVLAALDPFAKLVKKIIPEEEEEPDRFQVKFLDPSALDTPMVAFGNVVREILRMADIDQEMLSLSIQSFEKNDMKLVEKLEDMDDNVDLLNREIKFYLAKITQSELTAEQSKQEMKLINITNYLEIVGDIITKTINELAVKKIKKGFEFSIEGWKDIKAFHAKVCENFHIAVTAFASNNAELARKSLRNKTKIGEIEEELKQAHFMRLAQGTKESLLTSSIHLELLGHLRRINSYISKVAFIVTEQ